MNRNSGATSIGTAASPFTDRRGSAFPTATIGTSGTGTPVYRRFAVRERVQAHAFDVLDHAIRLDPDDFKLFRKRGAFHLICPDPWLQDLGRGFADLRRACELSGWRVDLVEWASGLLAEFGDERRAEELLE